MRVDRLIEMLQTFPEDTQVVVETPSGERHTVTGVVSYVGLIPRALLRVHKKETT